MSTKSILIIGQAPPSKPQVLPYDSTLLYEWFAECGISKEQAQEIFEFDAVYNKFPGYAVGGGHKAPSIAQMEEYWPTLEAKIQSVDKVILLGNAARDYFYSKPKTWSCNLEVLELMHPSRMNYNRYIKNKDTLISSLKKFLE